MDSHIRAESHALVVSMTEPPPGLVRRLVLASESRSGRPPAPVDTLAVRLRRWPGRRCWSARASLLPVPFAASRAGQWRPARIPGSSDYAVQSGRAVSVPLLHFGHGFSHRRLALVGASRPYRGNAVRIRIPRCQFPAAQSKQGGLFSDAHFLANSRITARLRERRPVSRKDWVTTLKPQETGRRICIIPPGSPRPR